MGTQGERWGYAAKCNPDAKREQHGTNATIAHDQTRSCQASKVWIKEQLDSDSESNVYRELHVRPNQKQTLRLTITELRVKVAGVLKIMVKSGRALAQEHRSRFGPFIFWGRAFPWFILLLQGRMWHTCGTGRFGSFSRLGLLVLTHSGANISRGCDSTLRPASEAKGPDMKPATAVLGAQPEIQTVGGLCLDLSALSLGSQARKNPGYQQIRPLVKEIH